jgi:hypothetical protein
LLELVDRWWRLFRGIFGRRFVRLVGRADWRYAGKGFRRRFGRRLGYLGLEHEGVFIPRKRPARAR